MSPRGFVVGGEAGRRIDLPGWSMLVKVAGSDTQGCLAVVEGRMAPRASGAAAHVHRGHDEAFLVLEGRLRFRLGNSFSTATAGDTVFAGRHLAHSFANPFDQPAHYVVMLTPSGYEDYFIELAARVDQTGIALVRDEAASMMGRYDTILAPTLLDDGDP